MLSNIDYLQYVRCPALFWKSYHEHIPSIIQQQIRTGRKRKCLSQKILTHHPTSFTPSQPVHNSCSFSEILSPRVPLHNLQISTSIVHAVVDLLNPSPRSSSAWNVGKVLVSDLEAAIKEIEFELYALQSIGLNIDEVHVMSVCDGKIDCMEVSAAIDMSCTEEHVIQVIKLMDQQVCPTCELGPRCLQPERCPLQRCCWSVS
jgi:hypothetical protein